MESEPFFDKDIDVFDMRHPSGARNFYLQAVPIIGVKKFT